MRRNGYYGRDPFSRKRRREYDEKYNSNRKRRKLNDSVSKNERLEKWKKKLEEEEVQRRIKKMKKRSTVKIQIDNKRNESIVKPPPGKMNALSSIQPEDSKNENEKNSKETKEEEIDPFDELMLSVEQELKNLENKKKEKNMSTVSMKDIMNSGKEENNNHRRGGKTNEEGNKEEEQEQDDEEYHKMLLKALKNDEVDEKEVFLEEDRSFIHEGFIDTEENSSSSLHPSNLPSSDHPLRATRKELKPVDHSKMNYIEFRKKLYICPKEHRDLLPSDIINLRNASFTHKIKVKGNKVPVPVSYWKQCGFSSILLDTLNDLGFEQPFAIQAQAIPTILDGRNIIGIAPTGSGKTLAFLLPMFRHILDQPPLRDGDGPIGLIMAPTRELAVQIHFDALKFCKPLNLKCACVYGGGNMSMQIAQLKTGTHVVVCTPGRMIDLLCANRGKVTNLTRVTYIVMDEADRMFDFGFGPQITRILMNVQPERQIVLFSATFPKPLEALARKILKKDYVEIIVGGRNTANKKIKQFVEVRDDDGKFFRLLELLGIWFGKGNILIFVKGKAETGLLYKDLLSSGYDCLVLHSGMDQIDRYETLKQFREGEKTILIGTSLVARGIDVRDIELVINYDVPNHYEDYVHQVGRTARANKEGTAYTFVKPDGEEEYSIDLIKALKQSGNPISEDLWKLKEKYDQQKKEGKAKKRHVLRGFFGSGFKFDIEEGGLKKKQNEIQMKALGINVDDDENGDENTFIDTLSSNKGKKDLSQNNSSAQELEKDITTKEKAKIVSLLQQKKGKVGDVNQALAFARSLTIQANLSNFVKNQEEFMKEIEINDYPQKARWKVTRSNSEYLFRITEESKCVVTPKGVFVPPGGNPPPGERKLYLLIEGKTKEDVETCRLRILQLLQQSSNE